MKLSRNFLSDYINLDIDFKELAEQMVFLGNEYDSYYKLSSATNLVVGEVLECDKHPESAKLSICKVNIGSEVKQILCGAPNIRAGQKVIVAKDGAILPGDIKIKNTKLAGYDSEGMICSLLELGIEKKYLTDEDIEGIHVLPVDSKVGDNPLDVIELNDEVIEFDLTADRSDLLSILGMAYEVAAKTKKEVKLPEDNYKEGNFSTNDNLKLNIETKNCMLYLAKLVKNIKIEESPNFIKNRLIASGIRPINNVVDISNYVMLETGQPLHFFDADKLGDSIIVRMATDKEKLVTLDGKERVLHETDIVIANQAEAVGLAGVMGGLDTEVTQNTKNIVIESALFNPINIRNSSKRVLRSEASRRFEKGIPKERTYMAIKRACYLLEKYASASISNDILVHDQVKDEVKQISITLENINTILGMNLSYNEVSEVFDRLKFEFKYEEGEFLVIAPKRRLDINIKEDLIEEIGRIIGYNNVEGILPRTSIKVGRRTVKMELVNKVKEMLVGYGLNETRTYSLVSDEESKMFLNEELNSIKLIDPISKEKAVMRKSLIPSLLNVYSYNHARSYKNVNVFEIGSVYYEGNGYNEVTKLSILLSGEFIQNKWQGNKISVDFYLLKGIIENIFEVLGFTSRYKFETASTLKDMHPYKSAKILVDREEIGFIGEVHPIVSKESLYVFEIDFDKLISKKIKNIKYKELTKYPSILKDLSFVVDTSMESDTLKEAINKLGGRLLNKVELFDVYVGDKIDSNKKALAYSLEFKDENRTLNDTEVMEIFNKIITGIEDKFDAKLRSN